MSHTTRVSPNTVFIHNGDYSGDVTLSLPADTAEMELIHSPSEDEGSIVQVKVPFEDLARFVANFVVDSRIGKLEQAGWEDVLLS